VSLREIETELATKFNAARQRTEDLDFEEEKERWIRKMESIKPKWGMFIFGKTS